ncbi:MAG: hypothetical protein F6J90_42095 [Moorea sp. SIOASIH]|uniref:hypothetical protein n=1 Tax=Moorena sp. SIOASIH TaxID=2607817 RepID=UPI0013BAAA73|nr:hypothetical protein [Moorena sp. SIOASIH]NEO42562.1 hypothetical protein [Moorena sp. SIOASIH]
MGSETLGSEAFRAKTRLSRLLFSATLAAVPSFLLPLASCLLPFAFFSKQRINLA